MLFSAAFRKRAQARLAENRSTSAKQNDADSRIERAFASMPEPVTNGLLPQTQVATARGWVPVGRLQPGDMVLTFDHGAQPLLEIAPPPDDLIRPARERAVAVPTGALENRSPMVLLPGQAVLLETDHAEDLFGDPFALAPAAALVGLRGIVSVEMPADPGLRLRFGQDQIIYAHGSTLVFCAASEGANRSELAQAPLSMQDARRLVQRLVEDEHVVGTDETDAEESLRAVGDTGR